MIAVPMNVAVQEEIPVSVSSGGSLVMAIESKYSVGGDPYTGDYTFTPTDETQTIATTGKLMTQDVVIHPVPSNYGRITYNGSTITVY